MKIPLIELSETVKVKIDQALQKYPKNQNQSAIMPALTIVQQANEGYLTPAIIEAVANYLSLPVISVYEVATFFSMYEHKPVGKYKICICSNLSCMLRGCDQIIKHLEKHLNIKIGETTSDKRFTLKRVECLGQCDIAPAMQINESLYGQLDCEKVDQVLSDLNKH